MIIEQRRRKFYAMLNIPPSVQKALGRVRFVQSLKTADRAIAEIRASVLKAQWLAAIERARAPKTLDEQAEWWRGVLKAAKTPEEREAVMDAMGQDDTATTVQDDASAAAERAGHNDTTEGQRLDRFAKIVHGELVRLDLHLDEYLATLADRIGAKQISMKRSNILRFVEDGHPYVADVTRRAVQKWIEQRAVLPGRGGNVLTLRKALADLRGYWEYLQTHEEVPDEHLPFERVSLKAAPRTGKADQRRPFDAADVVKLLDAAKGKGWQQVADLIELAMYTGARVEEICSLPVARVKGDVIEIDDAKTAAGWRQVPIHSKLKPTIERLVGVSTDGYVLSGLTRDKWGDRSGAIKQRFLRLRTEMEFDGRYVFHSIRKTVSTLLKRAGVGGNMIDELLGWEKAKVMREHYADDFTLDQKRKAIERLDYPATGREP
jgi:integrase